MRIGIMINCLEQGGAQNMVLRLFDALNRSGIETYLISMDRNQEIPLSHDAARTALLQEKVIFLSNADNRRGALQKVFTGPLHWFKLHRVVRDRGIDILVSFMERANILNLLTFVPRRKILSVRIHLSEDLSVKVPLKKAFIQFVYRFFLHRAEVINFNSREAALDFKKRFPIRDEKLSVIYNFIDVKKIRDLARRELSKEYRSFYRGFVFITAGRLYPTKGHVHLLRAFKKVSEGNAAARLILLGDGPLRRTLSDVIRKLGLETRVLLPGFQKNPFAWIHRADVFVLSSKEEGFPNALLEAIALGKPVISTDCPSGPREMLAPASDPLKKTDAMDLAPFGILTAPLNDIELDGVEDPPYPAEERLADAMRLMLEDDRLRKSLADASRKRGEEFSPERILPQWFRLLSLEKNIYNVAWQHLG